MSPGTQLSSTGQCRHLRTPVSVPRNSLALQDCLVQGTSEHRRESPAQASPERRKSFSGDPKEPRGASLNPPTMALAQTSGPAWGHLAPEPPISPIRPAQASTKPGLWGHQAGGMGAASSLCSVQSPGWTLETSKAGRQGHPSALEMTPKPCYAHPVPSVTSPFPRLTQVPTVLTRALAMDWKQRQGHAGRHSMAPQHSSVAPVNTRVATHSLKEGSAR